MFLKSLQLLGFKTFARQTEIQFDGGVTAIVGPNGSGKTNLVDAVKWVLGSGQAKDLRGKKMEEVIYAGGERRSRASYAEVTLCFDNTAGRLPVDYHEVAIKRRIEHDRESEYFLNGTAPLEYCSQAQHVAAGKHELAPVDQSTPAPDPTPSPQATLPTPIPLDTPTSPVDVPATPPVTDVTAPPRTR